MKKSAVVIRAFRELMMYHPQVWNCDPTDEPPKRVISFLKWYRDRFKEDSTYWVIKEALEWRSTIRYLAHFMVEAEEEAILQGEFQGEP